MYNGIQKIDEVIDYIESNLTSGLDCNFLAAQMGLSVYEFRRIFSFIVGCPLSEYIRKRRLSLAACEIMTAEKPDMLRISEKYGYASQSAFIKAFGEQHGVSPTACLKEGCGVNLFTRPKLQLYVSGRETVPFSIIKREAFYIQGLCGISDITDSCCCENVWNRFYAEGIDKILSVMGYGRQIYAAYQNGTEDVTCTIGACVESPVTGLNYVKVPQCRWARFQLNTVDDDTVNEKYSKIIYEWLPSANLKRKENMPAVEVYPSDMSEEGFAWEIHIPIL